MRDGQKVTRKPVNAIRVQSISGHEWRWTACESKKGLVHTLAAFILKSWKGIGTTNLSIIFELSSDLIVLLTN